MSEQARISLVHDSGLYNVTVSNPPSRSIHWALQVSSLTDGADLADVCEDVTLYFELNKTVSQPNLNKVFLHRVIVGWSERSNRLEGHCDERGTTEYNIALGQRRADAAAHFNGAGYS